MDGIKLGRPMETRGYETRAMRRGKYSSGGSSSSFENGPDLGALAAHSASVASNGSNHAGGGENAETGPLNRKVVSFSFVFEGQEVEITEDQAVLEMRQSTPRSAALRAHVRAHWPKYYKALLDRWNEVTEQLTKEADHNAGRRRKRSPDKELPADWKLRIIVECLFVARRRQVVHAREVLKVWAWQCLSDHRGRALDKRLGGEDHATEYVADDTNHDALVALHVERFWTDKPPTWRRLVMCKIAGLDTTQFRHVVGRNGSDPKRLDFLLTELCSTLFRRFAVWLKSNPVPPLIGAAPDLSEAANERTLLGRKQLSVEDAANILGKTPDAIYKMLERGQLPSCKVPEHPKSERMVHVIKLEDCWAYQDSRKVSSR